MSRCLIFAGTSEGRAAVSERIAAGDEVIACVTSQYGKALLPGGIIVYDHPMDGERMADVARLHAVEKIVDATHPFAALASKNIRACAERLALPYERTTRGRRTQRF